MTKKEFISILEETLKGRVPGDEIDRNISFYDNYFNDSSKTEAEVCDELGDPRLIARTIIDSYMNSKGAMSDMYERQARQEYTDENRQDEETHKSGNIIYRYLFERETMKWFEKVLFWGIVVAFAAVVLTVCALLLKIVVNVIIPVIAVFVIVGIIMALILK